MRTEACVCGGSITAPSLALSAPYVEAHNLSAVHQAWRRGIDITDLARESINRRPSIYRDPRRRWPTAGLVTVDLSETPGASADGSGGAV